MAWRIEYTDIAMRSMKRLDRQTAKRIDAYLHERIAMKSDPRKLGAALTGSRSGSWRYRIDDYRVICKIEDDRIVFLVLEVGHRREVYRKK